jgi:hypothetical protein
VDSFFPIFFLQAKRGLSYNETARNLPADPVMLSNEKWVSEAYFYKKIVSFEASHG